MIAAISLGWILLLVGREIAEAAPRADGVSSSDAPDSSQTSSPTLCLSVGFRNAMRATRCLPRFVSEVVANGLYSIAGAILMFASAPMRPWFRAWGWTVWLAGFALAIAGAMRWDAAIVASSGLLLAMFIPWVWLANHFLDESL